MESNPKVNVLDINLSNEIIEERELPQEIVKLYSDGASFGLYLLLQEMDQNADPLSPSNALIFTYAASIDLKKAENDLIITTKSPLNNSIGDSKVISALPNLLKEREIHAIVFRGKAKTPVYLHIGRDHLSIRSAKGVWGKVSDEAARILKKESDEENVEIVQIGPAGENMVKYSCIISMTNRANGRSGTGAVMGSKNLKAIVMNRSIE